MKRFIDCILHIIFHLSRDLSDDLRRLRRRRHCAIVPEPLPVAPTVSSSVFRSCGPKRSPPCVSKGLFGTFLVMDAWLRPEVSRWAGATNTVFRVFRRSPVSAMITTVLIPKASCCADSGFAFSDGCLCDTGIPLPSGWRGVGYNPPGCRRGWLCSLVFSFRSTLSTSCDVCSRPVQQHRQAPSCMEHRQCFGRVERGGAEE